MIEVIWRKVEPVYQWAMSTVVLLLSHGDKICALIHTPDCLGVEGAHTKWTVSVHLTNSM